MLGIGAGAQANSGNADDEGSERREAPAGRSRWRRHAGATGRDAGHREVRQGRGAARRSTDGRGRQRRGGRRGDWASGRPPVAAELGLTGAGGRGRHGARGHGEDRGARSGAALSSLRVAAATRGREGAMGEGESDAGVGSGRGEMGSSAGCSGGARERGGG